MAALFGPRLIQLPNNSITFANISNIFVADTYTSCQLQHKGKPFKNRLR